MINPLDILFIENKGTGFFGGPFGITGYQTTKQPNKVTKERNEVVEKLCGYPGSCENWNIGKYSCHDNITSNKKISYSKKLHR